MFNMIVAVSSIALIASMAAASIFYGGSLFSKSGAKADVNALISQGQQIQGAQQLHIVSNSGVAETTLQGLVQKRYLKAEPAAPARILDSVNDANWTIESAGGRLYARVKIDMDQSWNICEMVGEIGGLRDAETIEDLMDSSAQFGCIVDWENWGSREAIFGYKIGGRGLANDFETLARALVAIGTSLARDIRVSMEGIDVITLAADNPEELYDSMSDTLLSIVIPEAPSWTRSAWGYGALYSITGNSGILSSSVHINLRNIAPEVDTGGLEICDAIRPFTGGMAEDAEFIEGVSSGCEYGQLFLRDTVFFGESPTLDDDLSGDYPILADVGPLVRSAALASFENLDTSIPVETNEFTMTIEGHAFDVVENVFYGAKMVRYASELNTDINEVINLCAAIMEPFDAQGSPEFLNGSFDGGQVTCGVHEGGMGEVFVPGSYFAHLVISN
jgi:hypothetical protein